MTSASRHVNGIKSIQRGPVAIAAAGGSPSASTATITAVVTSKTELRNLGAHATGGAADAPGVSIVLTNSTTITATNGSAAPAVVSWELTEKF